jgi:hypothetical protein
MATATATKTKWTLKGRGYEFCNCDLPCGCVFDGFPNSKDGSCRALIGFDISRGNCGDVDLSGVKWAGIYDWPKAIHQGNGKVAFLADQAATDKQVEALGQIFTGALGGMPWEILGPTAAVVGLVRAKITIEGSGQKSIFRAEGIGEGRGEAFKNPVSGKDHFVQVHLPAGFIWKKGEFGVGRFRAAAAGVSIGAEKTNWILYEFDWAN